MSQEELSIELEEQIARDTLERYSGSEIHLFQDYILLTNFPKYLQQFAESRNRKIHQGSMFQAVHSPDEHITIIDFKIGSPAAALIVDLLAFLPVKAVLLLGMCGGLRRTFKVGDYFVPIASIRGEGTSDFYFPPEVPAMANFLVQKQVTNVLERRGIRYHSGITHTTNKRFWEFNATFRERIRITRPQAIEMECATLFMASYSYRVSLGALLLISDMPLEPAGIKTKRSSQAVFAKHTAEHVDLGVEVLTAVREIFEKGNRKIYRGARRRFEKGQTT